MIKFINGTDTGTWTPPASSLTYSHTSSGYKGILIVGVTIGTGGHAVTGVTYGGVAMTLAVSINNGVVANHRPVYIYYLVNPTPGTANVVVSLNGSEYISSYAASYSGINKKTPTNGTDSDFALPNPSLTLSVTTTKNKCWGILVASNPDGISSFSNITKRADNLDGVVYGDTNGPKDIGAFSTTQVDPTKRQTTAALLMITPSLLIRTLMI
jgi:hypothetical protein